MYDAGLNPLSLPSSRSPLLLSIVLAVSVATAGCHDTDATGAGATGGSGTGGSGTAASGTGPSSSSSGGNTSTSTSSTSGGGGPGCGNASATPGESVRQTEIAGVQRRFIVDAPAAIDPQAPLSLVFVFHGNGGTGEASQGMGLQSVPGAQDKAVFVFPDGLPFMNFGVGWNGACDGYDMEFFDTMIATLSSEYCIDASRIFAAGFSWGGDMCESLACCRGDVVRAIAPASGPELYPPGMVCPGTVRPSFRMTYADNDAYPASMFAERIDWFRQEQGCADSSSPVEPAPCVAWDGCTRPVVACEYPGLGHAWPQGWAEDTWLFFSQSP